MAITCGDIIDILEKQSPMSYAMSWDNVGLLVGRKTKEVSKILLALDATKEVCDYAINNSFDMIVTHHPMIFSKVGRVNDETVLGDKVLSLIEHGISCYAMHTNFDTIGGMAKLAANMLALQDISVLEETCEGEGIGQVGDLSNELTLLELANLVKAKFSLESVLVFGDFESKINRAAISPGSGKSVIDYAIGEKAQCLITGDIGHHEGIDAVDMGLNIIDASHYGLEKIFMQHIKEYILSKCDKIEVEILDTGVPYKVV